jgi:hypothetical protein
VEKREGPDSVVDLYVGVITAVKCILKKQYMSAKSTRMWLATDKWWVFVNTLMKLWVQYNHENLFTA